MILDVPLRGHSYQVIVEDGALLRTGAFCRERFPSASRCVLITDRNVGPIYATEVADSLQSEGFTCTQIVVAAGESSKSFRCLEDVSRRMIQAGLDRSSFVVALGGGVIGDLAGFAASIFFRGIPVVQLPTTIVAQVDSAVGGKTGINTEEGKNLIGAFHQPSLVVADPATLASLPGREFREGFAEVIKHAAIRDPGMFPELERIADSGTRSGLAPVIARNVAIKAAIVAADERETSGLRALLNFGHTIGHAVEASAGYGSLLHGEAISIGLRAALFLSVRCASLAPEDARLVLSLLARFGLPLVLPSGMDPDALMQILSRDKKFEQGAIRFVLLSAPGEAFVSRDITEPDLRAALEEIRTPIA